MYRMRTPLNIARLRILAGAAFACLLISAPLWGQEEALHRSRFFPGAEVSQEATPRIGITGQRGIVQPAERIQKLIRDLHDADESVRLLAAKELSQIGPAAGEAAPMLEKLTRDPDADVRQMAVIALARVTEAIFPPTLPRADLFVLSVGIDRYAPPINQLAGCVNDAEGMAKMFQRQANDTFGRVEAQILVDANATLAKIDGALKAMHGKGKAGDWYAIVLSGHGRPILNRWGFITHDGKDITDAALLGVADQLASEGKKILVIVDACFAGRMRYVAHSILNKHKEPGKGGIILMLSSMPTQTSAALVRYSAFARAVEEGLGGAADYDGNRTVTILELRRFTYNRVYELCLERRPFPGLVVEPQDSVIDASLSMADSTPITKGRMTPQRVHDVGPFATMPELYGTWVSGPYRLALNGNGAYRATLTQAMGVQSGDGIFQANAKNVILRHWQGDDQLEIVSLTSEAFHFRFQGREIRLRKENGAAAFAKLAGSTWTGTETLSGPAKLTVRFEAGGVALLLNAKVPVKGAWKQTADKVAIEFPDYVYEGTMRGNSMSGGARSKSEDRTWTFALSVAGAISQPPDEPPVNVAGTVWHGSESLAGFGALAFEFHMEGKAIMFDAQATVSGTWTQEGNQVTIRFQNCIYIGQIDGHVLSGSARYTQGEPQEWTFSVARAPRDSPGTNIGLSD